MYLSQFFKQLTFGELAHIAIGGSSYGEILPDDYEQITSHINMGLTDLHTRFRLREEEAIIELQNGMTEYWLHSDFADTNTASTEPVKYIRDSITHPFVDNILKIEQAFDQDGIELPFNDASATNSVYTPRFDILQVSDITNLSMVSVIYRANHEQLIANAATDPTTVRIYLQPGFIRALVYYVAARTLISKGPDADGNEGDKYWARYEAECQRLENLNIVAQPNTPNMRLEEMGWV